jgi:hypothetical protein
MLRHNAEQRAPTNEHPPGIWDVAAATCGMTLPQWMRATLDAEAKVATHVPIMKRRAVRGA